MGRCVGDAALAQAEAFAGMGIWQNWPRLFASAEEMLDENMRRNPTYPFTHVYGSTYTYRAKHPNYTYSMMLLGFSLLISLLFIALELYGEFYFLLPLFGVIVGALSLYEYREPREYWLHGSEKQYEFKVGEATVTRGDYYNVYVRLRRKIGAQRPVYYLIVNAFGMEKLVLSRTTSSARGLRLLGQQLAANLNINYFDEANISKHHVVRHLRPVRLKVKSTG